MMRVLNYKIVAVEIRVERSFSIWFSNHLKGSEIHRSPNEVQDLLNALDDGRDRTVAFEKFRGLVGGSTSFEAIFNALNTDDFCQSLLLLYFLMIANSVSSICPVSASAVRYLNTKVKNRDWFQCIAASINHSPLTTTQTAMINSNLSRIKISTSWDVRRHVSALATQGISGAPFDGDVVGSDPTELFGQDPGVGSLPRSMDTMLQDKLGISPKRSSSPATSESGSSDDGAALFPYLGGDFEYALSGQSSAPVILLWGSGQLVLAIDAVHTFLHSTQSWTEFVMNTDFLIFLYEMVRSGSNPTAVFAYFGDKEESTILEELMGILKTSTASFFARRSKTGVGGFDSRALARTTNAFWRIVSRRTDEGFMPHHLPRIMTFPPASPVLPNSLMVDVLCSDLAASLPPGSPPQIRPGFGQTGYTEHSILVKSVRQKIDLFLLVLFSTESKSQYASPDVIVPNSLMRLIIRYLGSQVDLTLVKFLNDRLLATPDAEWVADISGALLNVFKNPRNATCVFLDYYLGLSNSLSAPTDLDQLMAQFNADFWLYIEVLFFSIKDTKARESTARVVLMVAAKYSLKPAIEFFTGHPELLTPQIQTFLVDALLYSLQLRASVLGGDSSDNPYVRLLGGRSEDQSTRCVDLTLDELQEVSRLIGQENKLVYSGRMKPSFILVRSSKRVFGETCQYALESFVSKCSAQGSI